MSGICGIVGGSGEPIDREVFGAMTASMDFRGPDAKNVWVEGSIGLGHTLLRTTFESEHERQPASLDGTVWIAADARIDGQRELKAKLREHGRTGLEAANDAELILHAYHAWGSDCVAHLIGDFAFAIWDGTRHQLFCARDHFGVKPFFYARVGSTFIFSNTLNCIRKHPAVSRKLNDLSIADHLLFEFIQDPNATAFADIQRLAPAQCLMLAGNECRLRTYWELPDVKCETVRPARDYVDHFNELLALAVSDRLRTDRIAVEMSGGLDSTAVTAVAHLVLQAKQGRFELSAHTMVFNRLIASEERHFAGLTANKLAIPIHFCAADHAELFPPAGGRARPEPFHSPLPLLEDCTMVSAETYARVLFTGWDGDSLFNESPKPYFRSLLKRGHYMQAVRGSLHYAVWQRRIVPLVAIDWLDRRRGKQTVKAAGYPVWLDPALEERLALRARWEAHSVPNEAPHPIRPNAYKGLRNRLGMSSFFDFCDAGVTGRPLEFRHPLLDLRLVEYCLSLPAFPWCIKKEVLRVAMRGILPEPVRLRAKAPMGGHPHHVLLQQKSAAWIDGFVAAPGLERYVAREKIPSVTNDGDPFSTWINLRPLSLNRWLEGLQYTVEETKVSP